MNICAYNANLRLGIYMSKSLVFIMACMVSLAVHSGDGGYTRLHLDRYDQTSQLYYKDIGITVRPNKYYNRRNSPVYTIDIHIFNTKNNVITKLFNDNNPRNIIKLYFERSYNGKSRSINFGGSRSAYFRTNRFIRNNNNIKSRKPRDKLLIVASNYKGNSISFWSSRKNGLNLKKIVTYERPFKWHIDVYNKKLRIITTKRNSLVIKSFDW